MRSLNEEGKIILPESIMKNMEKMMMLGEKKDRRSCQLVYPIAKEIKNLGKNAHKTIKDDEDLDFYLDGMTNLADVTLNFGLDRGCIRSCSKKNTCNTYNNEVFGLHEEKNGACICNNRYIKDDTFQWQRIRNFGFK